jgi:hypothetical protein
MLLGMFAPAGGVMLGRIYDRRPVELKYLLSIE